MVPSLSSTCIAPINATTAYDLLDQVILENSLSFSYVNPNSKTSFTANDILESAKSQYEIDRRIALVQNNIRIQQNLYFVAGKCARAFVFRVSGKISPVVCKMAQVFDIEWFKDTMYSRFFNLCRSSKTCRETIFNNNYTNFLFDIWYGEEELQKKTNETLFDRSTTS